MIRRLRSPSRNKLLTSFRSPNAVALTFDDGPDPDYTPLVLELLKKHGIRATFFVLGRQAELYPQVLRDIVDSGSEIGNHSYSHPSFSSLSGYARLMELRNCERAIGNDCKKLFRPPYGHARGLTPFLASALGYMTIGWSAEVRDWDVLDERTIAKALADQVKPGAIVLLHDRIESARDPRAFDRSEMVAGLDIFLRKVADTYSFQTIGEMVASCEPVFGDAWDAKLSHEEMETIRRDLSGLVRNTG